MENIENYIKELRKKGLSDTMIKINILINNLFAYFIITIIIIIFWLLNYYLIENNIFIKSFLLIVGFLYLIKCVYLISSGIGKLEK